MKFKKWEHTYLNIEAKIKWPIKFWKERSICNVGATQEIKQEEEMGGRMKEMVTQLGSNG